MALGAAAQLARASGLGGTPVVIACSATFAFATRLGRWRSYAAIMDTHRVGWRCQQHASVVGVG
jgi:hypothetical protein